MEYNFGPNKNKRSLQYSQGLENETPNKQKLNNCRIMYNPKLKIV